MRFEGFLDLRQFGGGVDTAMFRFGVTGEFYLGGAIVEKSVLEIGELVRDV